MIIEWINRLIIKIQLFIWSRTHTMKDFERRLVELGCTRVSGRGSVIYTTPNRKGKIVIIGNDVLINPK